MKKSIPSKLLKKPFSTREALSCGLSKSYLTRMVKTGRLDRLSRGVYQTSGLNEGISEDLYRVARLRCGLPSVFCQLWNIITSRIRFQNRSGYLYRNPSVCCQKI